MLPGLLLGRLLGLLLGLLMGLPVAAGVGADAETVAGPPGCTNDAPVLRPIAFWNTVTKMTLYLYINQWRVAM